MKVKVLISAVLGSALAITGCSDSSSSTGGGGTAGGGMGGTPSAVDCSDLPAVDAYAVADVFADVPETSSNDCTEPVFMPGDNNAQRLNTRLENANPGDIVCMAEGTYEMENTISISLVEGLTLKGIGSSPDDTLLNFGGPGTGKGIFVQKDNVTIENLWVRNTGDNGIEQDGTSGSVFRKVHVSWTNADPTQNGPYGIYPTFCEDTLVEYSQATDASDAGIYIGKCGWGDDSTDGGRARYNIAARNVAGLEVENCLDVVAHDNLVIDNTGGLLTFQQPGAAGGGSTPSNTNVLVENNRVWCNNRENFATTGVVQIIPVGSGLLAISGNDGEIRNNDIQGNDTLGLAIVSNALTCEAAGEDCPPFDFADYNPYAQDIYAHDNYYLNNGTNADFASDFGPLFSLLEIGTSANPTPDVIWDGSIAPPGDEDPGICLGTDFTGTYIDLTNDQCQMSSDPIAYVGCILANNTTSTVGRLCAP